jgi:hypothetical protein
VALALQETEVLVAADHDVESAEGGSFLEEAHVAGMHLVKASRYHDRTARVLTPAGARRFRSAPAP